MLTTYCLGVEGRKAWVAGLDAVRPRLALSPAGNVGQRRGLWFAGFVGVALLFGVAVGQLTGMVPAVFAAWLLGALQTWPLLLLAVSPVLCWQLIACGLAAGSVSALWQDGQAVPWPAGSCIAALVALFVLGLAETSRVSVVNGLVGAGVVLVTAVFTVPLSWFEAGMVLLTASAITGAGAVLGELRRSHHALVVEREQREQSDRAQALADSRNRIASELHDVMAQHVSMIAVQAQAAPIRDPGLSVQTSQAFDNIYEASASVLTEMRRVIDVLRDADDGSGQVRLPRSSNLDDIGQLFDSWRQLGMAIAVTWSGDHQEIPESVSENAFRIVRESLTNIVRHAPGAPASVCIHRAPGALELRISNPIAGPYIGEATRGGHGLAGMAERATAAGGSFAAGPDAEESRWIVCAVLPTVGMA